MEQIDLENSLYEILYGTYYLYYDGQEYTSVPNTIQDKYHAGLIYQKSLNDVLFEDILTWEEAQRISEHMGIWTVKDEAGLKDLEKMLENTKLNLFLNYTNPSMVKQLKKKIYQLEKGISKSNNNKYTLYHATKEGLAENVRKKFLAAVSIRDSNGCQIYNMHNFWDANDILIELVLESTIYNSNINQKLIRKISRSEPWRSIWLVQKSDSIGKPATEWTDHQRILCSYSRMYDNVYESTECPADEVIEDDDILDGWFIKQRKEREEQKNSQSLDSNFNAHKGKGTQEVFMMANNKEEASAILNYNDATGKMVVKSRNDIVKNADGKVREQDMPDVRRNMQLQAVQQQKEALRRR